MNSKCLGAKNTNFELNKFKHDYLLPSMGGEHTTGNKQ
jgi:hypothetical protein